MIADKLNEALALKDMKPADLSRLSGIDSGQLSKYLTGKRRPQIDAIISLAQALGVSADFLLGMSDNPEPNIGEGGLSDVEREIIVSYRQGKRDKAAMLVLSTSGTSS